MNTQHFTNNDNQKFPLSTEALAFMQEQIKLAYGLTDLAGQNIIVKQSSATETGLVIYDGELLPLTGTPARFITIAQSTEQVNVEGRFTGTVRTTRTAVYAAVIRQRVGSTGTGSKAASAFTVLKSISTLMSELNEAQRHHVPTGAIMMWGGTFDNIPNGWALCDGQNGTPDLRARFIVGAGQSVVMDNSIGYQYGIGSTGGHNKIQLAESEMPKHNHDAGKSNSDKTVSTGDEHTTIPKFGGNGGGSSTIPDTTCFEIAGGNGSNGNDITATNLFNKHHHSLDLKARGGNDYHENRPLYYALAFIMKVI